LAGVSTTPKQETENFAPDSAGIIAVTNLVKVYGGRGPGRQEAVKALAGLSFSVETGEFFGFLGPNGSGKTTTIRIITTLLGKTSGKVSVAGYDLDRDAEEIRRIIGYAGQSIGVDGELTGRENLRLIARLYHLPPALVKSRVEEVLSVLELTDAADRPAFTYSGGMRRRLDLGAGLLHFPRVLFLDEPTTGLDPQTRNAVWHYLRKLHKHEGMTIFLTTQYMEEADQLCERLAIIDKGQIVAEGTPAQLKAEIGADVITIRVNRDASFETWRDRALALVRGIPTVKRANFFDEGISVHAENGGATLLDIVRLMDAEKFPIHEVALSHPTLDEVFLQHTGRQMRVEEVKPMSRMPMNRRRR
jgi:ABC-2 type transport system ATP-binding protein